GLTATTTFGNIPKLRSAYPTIRVVEDKRVVDNGKLLTTGGLTAGIDGALHLVSVLKGRGSAQLVALEEGYDWKPEAGCVRGTLAEANLQPWIDGSLDGAGQWKVLRSGGRERSMGDRRRGDLRALGERPRREIRQGRRRLGKVEEGRCGIHEVADGLI